MDIAILILLALSPGILYVSALVASAIKMKFFKEKCPERNERGLVQTNWIRATVLVDGKRAPDSWSYYCVKNAMLI